MKVLAQVTNVKEKAYKAANGSNATKLVVTIEVWRTNNVHIGGCVLCQDEPIPEVLKRIGYVV